MMGLDLGRWVRGLLGHYSSYPEPVSQSLSTFSTEFHPVLTILGAGHYYPHLTKKTKARGKLSNMTKPESWASLRQLSPGQSLDKT